MSSTTAAARRIRSGASSSASPAIGAATSSRRPTALCTALQLANFWQDFGVDYRRGRIYLPAEVQRPAAGPGRRSRAPASGREPGRSAFAEVVRRTRILFDQGRRCRSGQRPAAPGAAPDLAGRHAHPRPRVGAGPQPAAVAPDARRRRLPALLWGAAAGGGRIEGHPREMARDTNFYYSFLVLTPAAPRRSSRSGTSAAPSTTRWTRQGRDRGGSPGRPRPARRVAPRDRALLRRRGRRRPRRARRWCRSSSSSICRAGRSRIWSMAWRWTSAIAGSRTSPSLPILLSRRVDRRHRLRANLRLPGRPVTGLCDGPRRGAAAHQHPARREEGPRPGPRLHPARRDGPARRHRGMLAHDTASPAVRALLRVQGARARDYYARATRAIPPDESRRLIAAEIMSGSTRPSSARSSAATSTCSAKRCASRGRAGPGSR